MLTRIKRSLSMATTLNCQRFSTVYLKQWKARKLAREALQCQGLHDTRDKLFASIDVDHFGDCQFWLIKARDAQQKISIECCLGKQSLVLLKCHPLAEGAEISQSRNPEQRSWTLTWSIKSDNWERIILTSLFQCFELNREGREFVMQFLCEGTDYDNPSKRIMTLPDNNDGLVSK